MDAGGKTLDNRKYIVMWKAENGKCTGMNGTAVRRWPPQNNFTFYKKSHASFEYAWDFLFFNLRAKTFL